MIISIIKKIFEVIGLKVHRNKKNLSLINKDEWIPFKDGNEYIELYIALWYLCVVL